MRLEATPEERKEFLGDLDPYLDRPGSILAGWLSLNGITQKALSRKTRIPAWKISRIVRGRMAMDDKIRKRIALAVELPEVFLKNVEW